MQVRTVLPAAQALRWESVNVDREKQLVTIAVSSKLSSSKCPQCGQSSARIRRYLRKLADLPWHGLQVVVACRTRRFFCDNPCCLQRIFAERLPQVASPGSRRTYRMVTALRCVGFACGGEAGARLADRLGMHVSPDTLLREIRRAPIKVQATPRILGVDDFAFRRGQRYGVSRRVKPSGDRRVKTSHLRKDRFDLQDFWRLLPRKEARSGESTQDGENSGDTLVTRARLDTDPHRGDLAGRSGNGTKVRSAAVVRSKTSKRADRLGRLKTARFAERAGSGIKTSKRADRLTG